MSRGLIHQSMVFCLFAALATSITAEVNKPPNDRLKLVTGPHYAPYAADYLPHKGLAPFLVTQILEKAERTITVDIRPWKRAYRETLKGQYDAILPYVETPIREKDYLFSVAIFKANAYAYVRADSELDAYSLKELRGLTYCNPIGFTDENALAAMRANGHITRNTPANLKSCFQMLKAGRVDFVKTNPLVAHYVVGKSDLSADALKPLPFVIETVSLHLMVPKKRPGAEELINEFNRRFKTMKQTGRIEALEKEYLEALDPAAKSRIGPNAAGGLRR